MQITFNFLLTNYTVYLFKQNNKAMQKVKQQRSSSAIQYQIDALERQKLKPAVNTFAIDGKIKKLKIELANAKQYEFLAK